MCKTIFAHPPKYLVNYIFRGMGTFSHHQIQHHLLQLYPVSMNERQRIIQAGFYRDAMLCRFGADQRDNLANRLIDHDTLFSCGRLFDECAYAVVDDTNER
jgi:hypothetical protein